MEESRVDIPEIEQLNNAPEEQSQEALIKNLIEENNTLRKAIDEINDVRGYKRIEYLFKVIDFSSQFPKDIVNKAIAEIGNALYNEVENG